jgi:hypothetical protein
MIQYITEINFVLIIIVEMLRDLQHFMSNNDKEYLLKIDSGTIPCYVIFHLTANKKL